MRPSRRTHLAAYGVIAWLLPPEHRLRHRPQQIQLFDDLLRTGTPARRLWLNVAADLILVHRQQTTSQGRTLMSLAARVALVPLSLVNMAAGATIALAAMFLADIPVWVAGPYAAVSVQGLFTLLFISGRLRNLGPWVTQLFVLGEVGALLLGAIGLASATSTLSSPDPEYGPVTVMTLVVAHAVVGLAAAFLNPKDQLIKAD